MDCAVPSCTKHALAASFGACITCWRRFCGVHYKDADAHECYKLSKAARARLRQGIEQSAVSRSLKVEMGMGVSEPTGRPEETWC